MANAEQNRIAGEYVLGTLSAASRALVQARMQREPELAAAVRAWEARLQPLNSLAEPVAPSAALWPRIERSVTVQTNAARKPAAVTESALQRWWMSLSLWRGATGLSFAASLLMGVLLFTRMSAPPPTPQFMVVLAAPQGNTPGFVMQASSARRVQLIPLGVVQLPPDKALELWTHVDGAKPATSLGLIKPGQPIELRLDQFSIKPDMPFAISLEPPTGSPTGQPTGQVLYAGKAVKI
ncbi:MAG: anti-sigma factor [Burkholderiaceae bacterium]